MKILWIGYEPTGHIAPLLPLIKAFQEKGHQVDFYMEEHVFKFKKNRLELESYGCNIITKKWKANADFIKLTLRIFIKYFGCLNGINQMLRILANPVQVGGELAINDPIFYNTMNTIYFAMKTNAVNS